MFDDYDEENDPNDIDFDTDDEEDSPDGEDDQDYPSESPGRPSIRGGSSSRPKDSMEGDVDMGDYGGSDKDDLGRRGPGGRQPQGQSGRPPRPRFGGIGGRPQRHGFRSMKASTSHNNVTILKNVRVKRQTLTCPDDSGSGCRGKEDCLPSQECRRGSNDCVYRQCRRGHVSCRGNGERCRGRRCVKVCRLGNNLYIIYHWRQTGLKSGGAE